MSTVTSGDVNQALIEKLTKGGGASAGINLDTPIQSGGKAYTVAELLKARADLEAVQAASASDAAIAKNAKIMFTPGADRGAQRTAFESILKANGMPAEQVAAYSSQYFDAPTEETEDDLEGDEEQQPQRRGGTKLRPAKGQEDDALQQGLSQLQDELYEVRRARLSERLNSAVDLMVGNAEFQKLTKMAESLNGKDKAGPATDTLRKLGYDILVRNLQDRSKAAQRMGGRFQENWIAEEAEKAAKTVNDIYRTVIGDPDKLGKAPETESEYANYTRSQPVAEPQYDPNKVLGQQEGDFDRWATDHLVRGMLEIGGSSGATKA